ncbi:MAG: hypothetical protein PHQ04_05280 [Opitutaceae bacterium]|nr:hypothetical protein [Opitutaceae bacterium]
MKTRAHPWLLLLCLLLAAPLAAADLTIVRVQSGWRDADSFKRISEYFDGRENTGGRLVLRSQPTARAGYYFLVRVTNPGDPVAATIRLAVITPLAAAPVLHSFSTDLAAGDTVIEVGLTGSDWPGPKTNPVAWKLEFVSTAGQSIAVEQSFLWDKPAGPAP